MKLYLTQDDLIVAAIVGVVLLFLFYLAGKRSGEGKSNGWFVVLLIVMAGVIGFFVSDIFRDSMPSSSTSKSSPAKAISTPVPTSKPVSISSSRTVKMPDYKRLCPFTVSVPSGSEDYYVYLKYWRASGKSLTPRERSGSGTKSDISFYIKHGDSFSTEVPIGVYQLYYTCGETWYGTDERFGAGSPTYKSDDLLEFYDDGKYLQGHTVELWLQTNGNFDRTAIPESEFPS